MSRHAIRMYQDRLKALEQRYNERVAEKNILVDERDREQAKIDSKADTKLMLDKTIALLVQTADAAREGGKQRMEKVVTKALQSVFGPDMSFEIELDEQGGKPIANFLVVTQNPDGTIIKNEPQMSRGGGVNDIVAFALQAATMVVYNSPKIMGPWVLDEPGKHVSEDYVVKFGEFIDFIGKTFNRQIIMVTHQPHLAQTADRTLYSQLVGGKTKLTEHVPVGLLEEELDGESEIEWDA
ncbi:hypothetical protein D3C76_1094150 [compost metagenome]